jgi:hypothetical protein
MKGIDLMSFAAKWQRWWPLLAAVFVTAIALPGSGVLNGTPPVLVIIVAPVVAAVLWGFIELLAQQFRREQGKPPAVYPLHEAAAGPRAWLLTTPDAYRWLGVWLALTGLFCAAVSLLQDVVLTGILGVVALAVLLTWLVVWLVASAVVVAIVYARRFMLGFLCVPVFVALFVLTGLIAGKLGVASASAETWLAYGDGLLVVAAAVWWCRRHPRSIDPRTETSA